MYPATALIVTIIVSLSNAFGHQDVELSTFEVLETGRIDPYCPTTRACSTLYLYDSDGQVLKTVQGSQNRLKVRGVSKVQIVGSYGCYCIYKKRNFRSGGSFCWDSLHEFHIIGTPEADYEYTTIK